jgi:hypothetical protein
MVQERSLQVTYLWKGQILAYHLLGPRQRLTIGDRRGVTLPTPRLPGFPGRFRLIAPVRDGFRLRLGPGMSGQLTLRGQARTVADLLAQPAPRGFLRSPGMFREVEIYPGDSATVDFDAAGMVQIRISWAEAPERVPKPPWLRDFLLIRIGGVTASATVGLMVAIRVITSGMPSPGTEISQERFAKVVAPAMERPSLKAAEARRKSELAAEARRRREKEAAESRRAREREGRLGRADAPSKETVLPKGREDVLRAKVAKTGLLAALGTGRPPGSGLGRLLDTNDRADMDQAMNGLAGATLVAGRGEGGLGATGTGLGGGGTGFGQIQGSGKLDVGAGRGRGRKGPGLGRGREREVQVGMETGTADTEGGLTRDQVNRVVRAHAAAIRYCYEKELQRQPSLSGKVELYWVIRPNGSVDRARIASSSMGSRAVEGCMERQVKNWQFPRSETETIVQSYPFFFKGGG